MKNIQILPLTNMGLSEFRNKAISVGKSLKWKLKDDSNENAVLLTTSPNFDSLLGNTIEIKYLNPNIGVIIVASKNSLQVAESGDSSTKILGFVEEFYKNN